MSETQKLTMNVDEFLVWAEGQSGRHELVDGRVFAMAPERALHANVKFAVQTALKNAIRSANLECFMLPDGMTVRIDGRTAFEPDALVYCGRRLPGHAIEVPDPLIVVEVLSPSTRAYDAAEKFIDYFTLPSLGHYLIVDPERHIVVHHRRDGEAIATRIAGMGVLCLDPPGLDLAVETLFDEE